MPAFLPASFESVVPKRGDGVGVAEFDPLAMTLQLATDRP